MCGPPSNWRAPWRGRAIRLVHVSSLAAIGPATAGAPLAEDAEPHPLTHYGKSKLEAERVVRELAPDAVIVRPPVVYGPRDTDVFQLLKSISKGLVLEIAGGERWFSAIYVKDLVEGLLAAAGAPPPPGGPISWRMPNPSRGANLGASAARIMARTPRVVDGAVRRGQCGGRLRGSVGALERQAGDRLAREDRRSAMHGLDLRYRARRRGNSASWRRPHWTTAWPQPWPGTRRRVG